MWKNIVQRGRPQMTIWHMRIACWTTKATNTHTIYIIIIPFPMQQWLHERVSMLRYTYSASVCKLDNRQYLTIPKWYLRVTDYTDTRNIGHIITWRHSCPTKSAVQFLPPSQYNRAFTFSILAYLDVFDKIICFSIKIKLSKYLTN